MKKLAVILVVVLAGVFAFAQEENTFIEIIGIGMDGKSEATLDITNKENVQKIVVGAVQKSIDDALSVTFESALPQTIDADPVAVPYSGWPDILPWKVHVYEAEFQPADFITIHAGTNAMVSFYAYIYRSAQGLVSSMAGEPYHVFRNEDKPLVVEIPVPTASDDRDVKVKFGISELNDDNRYAYIKFKAGDLVLESDVYKWDDAVGEKPSYTVRNVEFEDVPGEVDLIEVSFISLDPVNETEKGDSFIAGVVVAEVPIEYEEREGFCSYTQGFYGNEGGKTCCGETTRELLSRLLVDDLTMGSGENAFTIAAGGVDCVLDLLPGGGPSAALSGKSDCNNLESISLNKQGRIKNTLLAQGITLALNLRNSPGLEDFTISTEPFYTRKCCSCKEGQEDFDGSVSRRAFKSEIVDFLGEGSTIADLMLLVNAALGGFEDMPLSLSQISDAATLVNEAFDECACLAEHDGSGNCEGPCDGDCDDGKDDGDDDEGDDDGDKDEGEGDDDEGDDDGDKDEGNGDGDCGCSGQGEGDDEGDDDGEEEDGDVGAKAKGVTGVSDANIATARIYPNPVSDMFFLNLPDESVQVRSAVIYNVSGIQVQQIDLSGNSDGAGTWKIDAGTMPAGLYIISISTDKGQISTRFSVK